MIVAEEGASPRDVEVLREEPVRAVETVDGGVVVRLAGELDLYNAEQVRAALLASAKQAPRRLVVDLSAVDFLDSTALGVLVEARARLADRNAFVLAAPGRETRRTLEISGLDRQFTVRDSVAEALAASSD